MLVIVMAALAVVMVMLVIVMATLTVVMVVLVVVMATLTVVMVVLVVVMAALAVVMVVLVHVMAALAVVMVVLVVVMATLAVVMVVLVVVMATLTVVMVMLVLMMVLVRLLFKSIKLSLESRFTLHSLKKLCTRKLIPRSRNNNRSIVVSLEKLYTLVNLLVRDALRMAEYDASGIFHLIVEEFTEILHMHLALFRIYNGSKSVEHRALCICSLNRLDNVGKLTYTGGLDKYSVGRKFIDDLLKCRGKIANKRATDAT